MASEPDSLTPLLEEIARQHFPNPPALPSQLDAFEQRMGWRLDPDLRAFYLRCDGAALFDRLEPPFRILPLSEVVRARSYLRGEDTDEAGPASWYTVCAALDGNCIILDVSHQEAGRYPIRDGYLEAFPDPDYCARIAGSFSEFLAGALRSNGRWFWMKDSQEP